jgi:hypothetical protein
MQTFWKPISLRIKFYINYRHEFFQDATPQKSLDRPVSGLSAMDFREAVCPGFLHPKL